MEAEAGVVIVPVDISQAKIASKKKAFPSLSNNDARRPDMEAEAGVVIVPVDTEDDISQAKIASKRLLDRLQCRRILVSSASVIHIRHWLGEAKKALKVLQKPAVPVELQEDDDALLHFLRRKFW